MQETMFRIRIPIKKTQNFSKFYHYASLPLNFKYWQKSKAFVLKVYSLNRFDNFVNFCLREAKKTRDLWWRGLPPSVRGKVWRQALDNQVSFFILIHLFHGIVRGINVRNHKVRLYIASWFDTMYCEYVTYYKMCYVFLKTFLCICHF